MAEIVPGAPRGTPATKELLPVRDCGDAAEGAAALACVISRSNREISYRGRAKMTSL